VGLGDAPAGGAPARVTAAPDAARLRSRLELVERRFLARSDDERAAWPQRAREAVTDLGLQAFSEVGEDDVPAEGKVERVGFANSGGLVFVDESAEEVVAA
jgi:hypothetical protein